MMKHKNFLSLLCAAGVVLASVPALPVIAAETAPVSTAAQGTAEEGETADGARWVCTNTGGIGTVGESAGKNGSFTFKWNDTEDARFSIYSVKAKNSGSKDRFTYSGQLELGDSGYYGISLEPYSFMNVYFVEGWAENSSVRKDAGEKISEITAEGKTYDVYRRESRLNDEDTILEYWIIPRTNLYDPAAHRIIKGSVSLNALLEQLESANIENAHFLLRAPALFVHGGKAASGKASGSAEFAYSCYGLIDGIFDGEAGGKTPDDYGWYTCSDYGIGEISYHTGTEGSFDFSWKDVERAYFMNTIPDRGSVSLSNLTEDFGKGAEYAGELDLGETGFFGASANWCGATLYFVEGYAEQCNEWGDADNWVGEFYVGCAYYDLYRNDAQANNGQPLRTYWCVRRDNQYYGKNSQIHDYIPIPAICSRISELNIENLSTDFSTGLDFFSLLVTSGFSETDRVSGSCSISKFVLTEMSTWYCEPLSQDGYEMMRLQNGYEYNTSIEFGENGTFKAEWTDLHPALRTMFASGKPYQVTLNEAESINCTYEIRKTSESFDPLYSTGVYGIVSTFADEIGENPVLTECYLTDAASPTAFFDPAQKVGEFYIGTIGYRVYLLPVNTEEAEPALYMTHHETKKLYWIERWWDAERGFIRPSDSCSVDLLQVFKELEKLGVKLNGVLTNISFFTQAYVGSGSMELLKNDIRLVEKEQPDTEWAVCGDANCDGALDVSDAVLASRILVEDTDAKISDQGLRNADIDRSGKLETADITMMLQVIAKKIVL